jgi:hypothetical protein
MSNIKVLIEQELKDFVYFMVEKGYTLRLEKEHSTITYDLLQKYINEYLENF